MILTDADEVLLNWITPFHDFIKSKGVKTFTEEPESWHLDEWIDHHSCFDLVDEFNRSEMFKTLKPLEGAVKYVSRLSAHDDIIVITSCGRYCEKERVENLKFYFGENTFKEIICLPTGSKKYEILSKYESSFWIEDHFKNAVDGANLGHKSLLIDRSYNKNLHHEKVRRVFNWEEIYNLIKDERKWN